MLISDKYCILNTLICSKPVERWPMVEAIGPSARKCSYTRRVKNKSHNQSGKPVGAWGSLDLYFDSAFEVRIVSQTRFCIALIMDQWSMYHIVYAYISGVQSNAQP